jgi:glutamate 5-kinase
MKRRRRQRWVVKLGTGILTNARGLLDLPQISRLVGQVTGLVRAGHEIIVVTSGAIGGGMGILGLKKRPVEIQELQTCAAIGQPQIMRIYEDNFTRHGLHVAQMLLTYLDIDSRELSANAASTLEHLLTLKTFIPIINENDVVSYEEIKFGDNDQLSAQVSLLVDADRLIILSNVEGLKLRQDGTGRLIPRVKKIDARIEGLAGMSRTQTSVGGMISKIKAAKMVLAEGIPMQIADGRVENVLLRIARGERIGTLFQA